MDLPLYTIVARTELSNLGSADYHLFDKAGLDTEQQLFCGFLLRLRDRQMTVEDWKHLMKQRPAVVGATTPFTETPHLFTTASDVAEHNIPNLHASGQPVAMLKAVHNGPGAFKATSDGLDPVTKRKSCSVQTCGWMLDWSMAPRGRSRNFERGFFFREYISHTLSTTFLILTSVNEIYM